MANLGCPIKSSKEYQDFLDNFGSEELLYAAYMSNGGVVPRSFSPERNHYIDDANSKIKATSEGKEGQSTKKVDPAINDVFNEFPELSEIGTQEQYFAYLDSIFPDSQVKDIVYHGTPAKNITRFNRSNIYFTNESDEAFNLGLEKFWTNLSSDIRRYFSDNTTDTYKNEYGLFEWTLVQAKNKKDGKRVERGFEKHIQFLQDNKIIDNNFDFNQIVNIYSSILNIKNPNFLKDNERFFKDFKKGNYTGDGIIGKDVMPFMSDNRTDTVYLVFEPEQIHILGSKQDIEGFKEFVNGNKNNSRSTTKYQRRYLNESLGESELAIRDIASQMTSKFGHRVKFVKYEIKPRNSYTVHDYIGNEVGTYRAQDIAYDAQRTEIKKAEADLARLKDLLEDWLSDEEASQVRIKNTKNKISKLEEYINTANYTTSYTYDIILISDRFNDDVRLVRKGILSKEEAENVLNTEFGWKGKNNGRVSVINLTNATLDTPIHEIAGHPLISAIKENNKELYSNLLKEIETGYGKEVYERVKETYKDHLDEDGVKEETIVELLGLYTAGKIKEKEETKSLISLLKRLLKEMTSHLRELFNKKVVKVTDLNSSMTIGDLATLLSYRDNKIVLPGMEVKFVTSDNKQFDTYDEAENYVTSLQGVTNNYDIEHIKEFTTLSGKDINRIKSIKNQIDQDEADLNSESNKEYLKERLEIAKEHLEKYKKEKFKDHIHKDVRISLNKYQKKFYKIDENSEAYLVVDTYTYISDDTEKEFKNKYLVDGYLKYVPKIIVVDHNNPEVVSIKEFYISAQEANMMYNNETDLTQKYGYKVAERYSDLLKDVVFYENGGYYGKKIREAQAEIEEILKGDTLNYEDFAKENEDFELSKYAIEQAKRELNIHYDPQEAYDKGYGFYSSIGMYSKVDLMMLFKNLLNNIQLKNKLGSDYVISAYNKPVNSFDSSLENSEWTIKYVIYPESKDIKWAASKDVWSGSIYKPNIDMYASEFFTKASPEVAGISFTKAPNEYSLNSVSDSLSASIDVSNNNSTYNELGVALTLSNFRLEYDASVPNDIKKTIDRINKELDSKFGKLNKPNISEKVDHSETDYDSIPNHLASKAVEIFKNNKNKFKEQHETNLNLEMALHLANSNNLKRGTITSIVTPSKNYVDPTDTKFQRGKQNEKQPTHPVDKVNSQYSGNFKVEGVGEDLSVTGYPVSKEGINSLKELEESYERQNILQRNEELEETVRPLNRYEGGTIKHKPNDPTKGTYIIDFKGDFSLFKDGSKVVSFKANISEGNATVNGNMTQSQRNDVRGVLKDRGVTEVSFEGEVIPAKQDPKGIDEHTINEQVSVLSKAMPQITNFIPDTTMSQVGVLEAGGETIRYNPLYMEHDTLGHEYGHLLIDLMGGMSNELIKRGVAQLKGTELERSILETYKDLNDTPDGKERIQKEILAQAIGKEVAKIFESEAKRSAFTRWLNRFFRNLKVSLGLERNVAKALAAKLTGGREISDKAFTGKVSNYMQEQRVVAGFQELVSPKEVSDVLMNMGKPVTFEETGHTYSVTVGGETKLLDPVSTVMADNGFGDKEIVQTEALLRGQSIGTLAHATLDSVVKGVVNKVNTLNGFTLSAEAQSQLRGIVSNLIGKDDIALTEVIIPHDKAQMAGTADLIIIKPDKSIHVYDFKTKMKFGTKGEYKGFKYYSSTKFGISNKETNRLQLSLYAEMIEQATNLVVEPVLNIVPLVYTINGKTVTGIEADKVFGGKEGIIKLTRNNLAARILRSRARVNAFNKGERKIAETPDEAMSGEPLTDIESRYEALYNRIIASLNSRINTLEATGKDFDANKTKELLVALQGMESKRGVLEFLMSSRSSLDSILKVYDTHKGPIARGEGSTVITPDVIVKWHKQVMGMDSLLDDINNLLITDLYEGDPKSVSEILKAEVRSLVSKKNFVRDLYKTVGKDILRDNMYMYTGKVAKTIYEDKQREWLAMDGAKRTESGFKSSEEYAQNYIETHAKEIDDNTRRAFDSELAIASKDTNSLIRWLDSMATTDDMVIGAIIKKFMILEGNARDKYLDLKEDVIIALEGLEKATGYGMSTDPVKMYDFMLERDSKGNLTGHIVDEYVSSLFEEEKEMLKMSSSMNVNERRTFRNKWYEERFNYNKEKFNEDLTEFVDFLHAAGRISDIEYSLYTRNRSSEDNYFYKIEQLFNPEAATEFIEWIMHNKRNYYTPKEQYKNPQYAKLAAATRNASDPMTVFYNTILKIIELEQSIVPNNRQLKTQLPFDFKSSLERSKAGQSFKNIAKDQFQSGLIKREDDIDRAPLEDEAGNDINYVPLRYGRPSEWRAENQSFDLAALYLNYAKHVLDYGTRTELLSEMELATLLIENRKYTQLDPNGNPIKRLIDGFGAWAKTKEGITSNLSAMWQDWMKANIYGQRKAEEGSWDIFGTKIDRAKTYDLLNKYTAMNLLGLNVMSGIANINMGESAQIIEALTGRFITMKDLQKATNIYFRNVGGMAYSDFGNRRPTNVISALIEKWNILNDFNKESTILNNRLVNGVTDSMFITSSIGEHFMQGRLMIAMLSKVKAFDSNGKELGNMVDMYSMKDGKLTLNPEVDQNKSKWTMDKQILFGEKVKQLATAMHGEYTEVGKSAIQRYGLGRMAILFRRFIVPNVKRRYQGLSYNNLMDEFNEGTYVTTYRFLKDVITGLKNDTKTEVWARLLPREKANVLNTAYEVMFMISTALLTAFLFGKAKDTDDDDEKFWLNHMAYQAYRLNSELTFYFHPGSAAEILRSPAASQAVVTSTIKFIDGIMPWNFGDKYEKGNWKGKYKWEKPLSQMAPVYRQYLRIRDVDDLNKAVNKN